MSLHVGEVKGGATVEIRLRPRASRKGVAGVREGILDLRVTAPPVEGKANAAAAVLLADLLGAPPSAVLLRSGGKSRKKVFLVKGMKAADVKRILEEGLKKP